MNTLNNNAILTCSFGILPQKVILFVPRSRVMVQAMPLCDIMHLQPMMAIPSFGMCSSMMNPMVVTATAAAMGVLVPMPCIPMPAGPWITGSPLVQATGMPIVNVSHQIMCAYGGCIKAIFPGCMTVMSK